MTGIHQIWWTSIIHIWLASRIQYMRTSYMMDIHLIHKWWTFIIFINDGHPSYSLMMDIHNIWHLSYMTNTLLTGPSLSSKPLQEHKLIIIMELHHYWLSNTLLFIFQIKYTLVKSILLIPKWNFWNPVAKFDIDPIAQIALDHHPSSVKRWLFYFSIYWLHTKTSQELRMLSRSLSDCRSLLLNLNLNLNRCLCLCSDCSVTVVSL